VPERRSTIGGRRPARARFSSLAPLAPFAPPALLAWIALLALLAFGSSAVMGQERGVEERRTELARLKKQVEEKRKSIEKLKRQGENVDKLLAEIERERSLTERYLEKIVSQEQALTTEFDGHRNHLAASQRRCEELRADLSRALVSYYKERRVDAAELLVSSATFGELFARSHYWMRLIRKFQSQIDQLEEVRADVTQEMTAVERRRQEVADLRAEREAQLAHLAEQEGESRQQRAKLKKAVASQEEQTRKLLASQKEIERLIEQALKSSKKTGGKGFFGKQGKMPWPVEGKVISRFGTQEHPVYHTQVENKGIEIQAAEGTPVRAVMSGRVVYEGWLEGYGRTVVLDHGNGFFTLYAHASETLVSRNDKVEEGQAIARVGSTDSLLGAALYFEIRQEARALDPLRWLKGR